MLKSLELKDLMFQGVAIPLNRVGVSMQKELLRVHCSTLCRNPLKSGRCFNAWKNKIQKEQLKKVAIPLNRVGVSIRGTR